MQNDTERTVLAEIIELHPEHLTAAELILRVAPDPADQGAEEEVRHAVRDLRRSGLVRYRDDGVVEPTHAALRAFVLFTA